MVDSHPFGSAWLDEGLRESARDHEMCHSLGLLSGQAKHGRSRRGDTDQRDALCADGVQHRNEIAIVELEAVGGTLAWPIRSPVAAAIHRDHAKILRQIRNGR